MTCRWGQGSASIFRCGISTAPVKKLGRFFDQDGKPAGVAGDGGRVFYLREPVQIGRFTEYQNILGRVYVGVGSVSAFHAAESSLIWSVFQRHIHTLDRSAAA